MKRFILVLFVLTIVSLSYAQIIDYPYNESFENGGSIPSGWINDSGDSGENWLFVTTMSYGPPSAHTGSYYAAVDDSSPNNNPTNLLSPIFDTTGLSTVELSFYYQIGRGGTNCPTLYVDVYDGSTWNDHLLTLGRQTSWGYRTLDITSYSNDALQIRFSCVEPTGYTCDVGLDDVTVDGEPALPVTLSEFTAEYVAGNLALYWTTQTETNNSGWNIYRGESEEAHQNDESIQINPTLVPGAGTTSEPTDYMFVDENEVSEGSTYWYWIEGISSSGETDTFGPISLRIPVAGENPDNPDYNNYGLFNYPNPLSNSTSISFNLPEETNCELTIYNIKGEIVRTFSDNNVKTGEFKWDGKDKNGNNVQSGIYFYKLNTGDDTYIKKMILTK